MDAVELLKEQLRQAHAFLEGLMSAVTDEQAHWPPPAKANPLGVTYAHVTLGEDAFIALLANRRPLFAAQWEGRTGVSAMPPVGAPGTFPPLLPGWHDWAREVRIDLEATRHYAQAVHVGSAAYLDGLCTADLDRPVVIGGDELPFGTQTLGWALSVGLIGHTYAHWGEAACLLGLQGAQGYQI